MSTLGACSGITFIVWTCVFCCEKCGIIFQNWNGDWNISNLLWPYKMIQSHSHSYFECASQRREVVCNTIKSFIHILDHTINIMSQDMQSVLLKARWTDPEVDALVDFLAEHHSKGGDGGNFKNVTFQAVVVHLRPLLEGGKPKDMKSIKYKWMQVSLLACHISTKPWQIWVQLKATYKAICT